MKPIKLEIEGIHSFKEKQTIDFEKLTSGGVFGIFGPTGSGKSTILDAITLCLYGKVSRSKLNSDFINSKCNSARVMMQFEIALNGENPVMEVERIFKFKKNKKDVDQSAKLTEIKGKNKQVISEGASRVDQAIEKLLGLKIDEFTKCIALPQGEFAGFLKARPSERTDIIGSIFNLKEFGDELWQRVKSRNDELTTKGKVLESQAELLSGVNEEDLKRDRAELVKKKEELLNVENELKVVNETYSKAREVIFKENRLKSCEKELKELNQSKVKIADDEELLKKYREVSVVADDVISARLTEEGVQKLTGEIKMKRTALSDKNKEFIQKKKELNEEEKSLESFINSTIVRTEKLRTLKENQVKINQMKAEVARTEEELVLKKKSVDLVEQEESVLEGEKRRLQAEIERQQGIIERSEKSKDDFKIIQEVNEIEKQLAILSEYDIKISCLIDDKKEQKERDYEELNTLKQRERQESSKMQQVVDSINNVFSDKELSSYEKLRKSDFQLFAMREVKYKVDFKNDEIKKLLAENDFRLDKIQQLQKELTAAEKGLKDKDKLVADADALLKTISEDREATLGETFLSTLVDSVAIGEECPVCRATIVQKKILEKSDLKGFDSTLFQARTSRKILADERDKQFGKVVSLSTRMEEQSAIIKENQKRIREIKEEIKNEYIKFVDINELSEKRFGELVVVVEQTIENLEKLIEHEEKIKGVLDAIHDKGIEVGTRANAKTEEIESLIALVQSILDDKAEKELKIYNYQEKFAGLRISELKNKIEQELAVAEKAHEEKEDLLTRQSKVMQHLHQVSAAGAEAKVSLKALKEKCENVKQQIALLNAPIKAETPDGNIDGEIERIKNAAEIKKKDYGILKEVLEERANEVVELGNETEKLQAVLSEKEELLASYRSKLDKLTHELGLKNIKELEMYAVTADEREKLEKSIKEYHTEFAVISKEYEDLAAILKDNEGKVYDALAIQKQKEELDEKSKILSSEIGQLTVTTERAQKDLSQSIEINTELTKNTEQLNIVRDLYDVLKGKSLMEYVAEEYMSDIIIYANAKLNMLMDGRYELVSENKEFFVIDNFEDGAKRSADTLSGGETFIVSLCLALAISEAIIALSGRSMEFFFLDEGFGTLDNELCETVIYALNKLESKNMNIGLISHVPELQNAIKNRLIVTPAKGNAGSTVKVELSI